MSDDLIYHYTEGETDDSVLVVGTVEGQTPKDAILVHLRINPSYRPVVTSFAANTEWRGETYDPDGGAEITLTEDEMYDNGADPETAGLTDRAVAAFADWCEWYSVGGMGIAYYLVGER